MAHTPMQLRIALALLIGAAANSLVGQQPAPTGLERELLGERPVALAQAARATGDAVRGAIVFHQAQSACAKCHRVDGQPGGLGPELTALPTDATDSHLVESVLAPSRVIRKNFETTVLVDSEGRTHTGIVIQSDQRQVVLRDATQPGKTITVPADRIEQRKVVDQSTMPSGQVNQLGSRQQFLDLIKYLIELRDGGVDRARQLQPAPALIALQLPEYEQHIDHAGMLRSLDSAALDRGRAIYERLCVNCHGTPEQPGSLPTSLRFATGKFKNGPDPYTMYQTLTRGFGLMTPQTWMVPQQKYDVIHYIRETYLKPLNPTQYVAVNDRYLRDLPLGNTRGPAPQKFEPWSAMDYGPTLIGTYEVGQGGRNIAYKGIAVRLDAGTGGIARGTAWMVFDHDTLRVAAAWTGQGFIDWQGIHFDGRHNAHPHLVGQRTIDNPTGPGWADPSSGSFGDNRRVVGRDDRRYGPLPRDWARYRGLYHHGDRAIIAYSVGDTEVLELPGLVDCEAGPKTHWPVFTRTLELGARAADRVLLVASAPGGQATRHAQGAAVRFGPAAGGATADKAGEAQPAAAILAGVQTTGQNPTWEVNDGRLCLRIPAVDQPTVLTVWTAREPAEMAAAEAIPTIAAAVKSRDEPRDLRALLQGGPPHWNQVLTTTVQRGTDDGPLAVDVLTHPAVNPWLAQLRLTGLDFLPGGDEVLVCAWDGDVWRVSGLQNLDAPARKSDGAPSATLTWRRIASGLFQPLGIKFHDGQIYVTCRDQLVILRDLNRDGETDFYECFNNDHQVTEHFHEFAMGLQVDAAGNFYYAKSARHALPALVPHHGTLLRVSPDGARTDILARGFRAANGVCVNPDGTFVVTDQEGHWNPKNRINWVKPGGFYGNMFAYHDVTDTADSAMEQPLCWITNAFDRSPAELLWTPRDAWGPLGGSLLNLSYGYGKAYVVPFEEVEGRKQGGMCALPIPALPTGIMRGRFHPVDHQLYTCGMFAWAGSATAPGGFYRLRYTGKPFWMPVGLQARAGQIEITFTEPLDARAAVDPANYQLKTWALKRTADYGSAHYDERPLPVRSVSRSADGRTVTLDVPELRPTWGMEIVCRLRSADGPRFERVIHNSVFQLK